MNNPLNNYPMNVMPGVVETTPRGERFRSIFDILLQERVIMLFTPINAEIATTVIAQLLYLEREDPDKDISMYIQSPGGEIRAGLAIYDTMQFIRPQISTICVGVAASMAAVLLCAGAKGKRFSLPNSTILIHQPTGGTQGQASDIIIEAREITRLRDILNGVLVNHTGQPLDIIARDTDRDFWMDPKQAKEYGIIDEILTKTVIEPKKK